jgi:hypothetical protein
MAPDNKDKDKEKGGLGTLSLRTKSIASPQQQTRPDNGIITLRYEEALPAKPPIAVTVAPPRAPPTDTHPALRRPRSGVEETGENKRDSGLAPTTSSKAREGSVNTVDEIVLGLKIDFDLGTQSINPPQTPVPSTPKVAERDSIGSGSVGRWRRPSLRKSTPRTPTSKSTQEEFSPITTPIPTESLIDEDFLEGITFSKRGSMMLGGKKAVDGHARSHGGRRFDLYYARQRIVANKCQTTQFLHVSLTIYQNTIRRS